MIGIQIAALVFITFMMYVVRIHSAKKDLPAWEVWLWGLIWMGAAIVVLFPRLFEPITVVFSIYRVFDLVTVVAFMLLFWTVIEQRSEMFRLKRKIESLTRKLSLEEE